MKATEQLQSLGQSLWLDNITRDLLTSGTLQRYIDELSVTGLTSNPSIFDHAITHSKAYDEEIRRQAGAGKTDEALFFELAIQDLTKAADMFATVNKRTAGVDGWVSLEVSPLIAHDTARTVAEARALHAKANCPNLFIEIPGTLEGLPAIEEAIFSGSRSTSRCCSPATTMCGRQTPTCVVWSAAFPPASIRTCAPSPRSL